MEIIQDFKLLFQFLSNGCKKVFRYLHWFSRKKIHVFPSLETIAEGTNLSRRTVIYSLAFFKSKGWITWIKRHYQSNVYIMAPELVGINLNDPKTWDNPDTQNPPESRDDCTANCTVLSESICTLSYLSKNNAPSGAIEKTEPKKKEQEPPEQAKQMLRSCEKQGIAVKISVLTRWFWRYGVASIKWAMDYVRRRPEIVNQEAFMETLLKSTKHNKGTSHGKTYHQQDTFQGFDPKPFEPDGTVDYWERSIWGEEGYAGGA